MGLNVLPFEGLVIVPWFPGGSAWPIARLFKGGLEREGRGGPLNSVCGCVCMYVCVVVCVCVCCGVCGCVCVCVVVGGVVVSHGVCVY